MARNYWSLLRIGVLLALCVGCAEKGPKLGRVTGTITLEGEPVEGAFVTFMALFGGAEANSAEKTDANGYFEMQYSVDRRGVLLGEHQVQVSTQDWEKQPDGSNKVIKERIPRHYIGPDSVLRFTVVEGANDASFDLKKKMPK